MCLLGNRDLSHVFVVVPCSHLSSAQEEHLNREVFAWFPNLPLPGLKLSSKAKNPLAMFALPGLKKDQAKVKRQYKMLLFTL